jgi:hypothetical protein
MVRMRASIISVAILALACGCASKQDYRVISAANRDDVLATSKYVIEGRVIGARISYRPVWQNYVFFWLPIGVSTMNARYDATVEIDAVLKGDVKPEMIELRNYRPLSTNERALLPDEYGIHNGLRLRLGFDRRRGDSISGLAIVPLGNTPEFDEALRRTRRRDAPFAK